MVQENSLVLQKEKIIVIAGPTCVGKSAYGVELAKKYNGEIISADSVQFYRGLDIGSGKLTRSEMKGIPHYMLDTVFPYENFTVADFLSQAKSIITDIIHRGKVPFIVGGTGFYINALIHGYNCGTTGPNEKLRAKLQKLEEIKGNGYLYCCLEKIVPSTSIMPNDTFRVIRQLEQALSPTFDSNEAPEFTDVYDALMIVLDADRAKLDELAENRIRGMIEGGFIDEVRGLRRYYSARVFNSVGYREMRQYILNEDCVTLEETIDEIKNSYHALIKKQQTFFKWMKVENKIYSMNGDRTSVNKEVKKFLEK